jgi:flagellar basal-body rod protein FlgF
MNRGVYIAARGMMVTTQWMDTVSNNLANASTDGYKADLISFSEVLYRDMHAHGGSGKSLGSMGGGPQTVRETQDFSVGSLRSTGNSLDVAIRTPGGMFAVQANNTVRYTRDGSFTISKNRELVTNEGYPVLDYRGQKIPVLGVGKVTIGEDGDIQQDGSSVTKLGVFNGQFQKEGGNLWMPKGQVQASQVAEIAVGHLESSNVEAIEAMVELIKINRAYEMSQKTITTQDDMTGRLIDSLSR